MASMSKQEFEASMTLLADLTSRTLTERQREFFWTQAKFVDGQKLRVAINVFAAKGHMPTLNELMIECGYVPSRTRQEQEELDARKAKQPKRELPSNGATPESAWGEWTFEVRHETEDEDEAKAAFSRIRTERLERAGWVVRSEDFFRCREEVAEGKRYKPATIFKATFHCWRPEPEPPRQFDSKQAPVKDFKAASAGDLGHWDPEG